MNQYLRKRANDQSKLIPEALEIFKEFLLSIMFQGICCICENMLAKS